MSMNTSSGSGGASAEPVTRYTLNASTGHNHAPPPQDRRRRGKNLNYYNSGPRGDGRMGGGGYRTDNRMNHRAAGDGPHNGTSSYRGSSDYDQHQQQTCVGQYSAPPSEGHMRSNNHHHHSSGMNHHYHHYQSHNSHHHQSNSIDYDRDAMPGSRPLRGSASSSAVPRMDLRNSMQHQQEGCTHPHQHSSGYVVNGGGGHQMGAGEIVVVNSPPEHQNHVPLASSGQGNLFPQFTGPPPATLGFFGYPSTQPMFGSLVLCHVPYGINPGSVISPGVYSQVIGHGIIMPGMPYNMPCAMPSPMVPGVPVLLHPQQHPQHHHHISPQPHYTGPVSGIPVQIQQSTADDCVGFDSTLLNPDADAFFPPAFPPATEDNGDGGGETVVDDEGIEAAEIKPTDQDTPTRQQNIEEENTSEDGDEIGGSPVTKNSEDDAK